MAMMWPKLLVCDSSAGKGKVANQQFALPGDDKTNRNHEPYDREQENRADDLIAGEAHRRSRSVVHLR